MINVLKSFSINHNKILTSLLNNQHQQRKDEPILRSKKNIKIPPSNKLMGYLNKINHQIPSNFQKFETLIAESIPNGNIYENLKTIIISSNPRSLFAPDNISHTYLDYKYILEKIIFTPNNTVYLHQIFIDIFNQIKNYELSIICPQDECYVITEKSVNLLGSELISRYDKNITDFIYDTKVTKSIIIEYLLDIKNKNRKKLMYYILFIDLFLHYNIISMEEYCEFIIFFHNLNNIYLNSNINSEIFKQNHDIYAYNLIIIRKLIDKNKISIILNNKILKDQIDQNCLEIKKRFVYYS